MDTIAILESEWFNDHRFETSVQPMFRTLQSVYGTSDLSAFYERFVGETSFFEALDFFVKMKRARWLCIATHGDHAVRRPSSEVICCPNGDEITRVKIRNFLKGKRRRIEGIFFGSCIFGNERNLDFLLDDPEVGTTWVAGYVESVNWIDSSALDLLFWNEMLFSEGQARTRIANVGRNLRIRVPSLVKELGFTLRYWNGKRIVDALA